MPVTHTSDSTVPPQPPGLIAKIPFKIAIQGPSRICDLNPRQPPKIAPRGVSSAATSSFLTAQDIVEFFGQGQDELLLADLAPQLQDLIVEPLELFGVRLSGRVGPVLIGKAAQVPLVVAGVHMAIVGSGIAPQRYGCPRHLNVVLPLPDQQTGQ